MGCNQNIKPRLFVVSSSKAKWPFAKIAIGVIAAGFIVFMLAACGGGGGDPGGAVVPTKPTKSIGPQLRPCETTGPEAPPCPSAK